MRKYDGIERRYEPGAQYPLSRRERQRSLRLRLWLLLLLGSNPAVSEHGVPKVLSRSSLSGFLAQTSKLSAYDTGEFLCCQSGGMSTATHG